MKLEMDRQRKAQLKLEKTAANDKSMSQQMNEEDITPNGDLASMQIELPLPSTDSRPSSLMDFAQLLGTFAVIPQLNAPAIITQPIVESQDLSNRLIESVYIYRPVHPVQSESDYRQPPEQNMAIVNVNDKTITCKWIFSKPEPQDSELCNSSIFEIVDCLSKKLILAGKYCCRVELNV